MNRSVPIIWGNKWGLRPGILQFLTGFLIVFKPSNISYYGNVGNLCGEHETVELFFFSMLWSSNSFLGSYNSLASSWNKGDGLRQQQNEKKKKCRQPESAVDVYGWTCWCMKTQRPCHLRVCVCVCVMHQLLKHVHHSCRSTVNRPCRRWPKCSACRPFPTSPLGILRPTQTDVFTLVVCSVKVHPEVMWHKKGRCSFFIYGKQSKRQWSVRRWLRQCLQLYCTHKKWSESPINTLFWGNAD